MSSTKNKAKQFLRKLFNNEEQEASTSRPHPSPPNVIPENFSPELFHSFGALSISEPDARPQNHSSNDTFVGGFNPRVFPVKNPPTILFPAPYAQAPAIPSPANVSLPAQSLTMQMALRPEEHIVKPTVDSTRKSKVSPTRSSVSVSTATVSMSTTPSRSTSTNTPLRPRVPSSPHSPRNQNLTSGRQQCAGVTKAGKQCMRQVKLSSDRWKVDSLDDDSTYPVFCFQHLKELMGPSGFYGRKDGTWINFSDWIPHYLQADTQVALRVEMEKARSSSDVPGYIYTFEIRDPDANGTVKLKVGRAVNLVKRIDQWGKQCGSKEQVLRGYYPGATKSIDTSLMKGRLQAGKPGPWCHRMERLIHIELADLVASAVYLAPTWPKVSPQIGESSSTKKSIDSDAASGPCPDCGNHHKEIFEFRRLAGKLRGQEWEAIVQPVIERWGRFVEQCV